MTTERINRFDATLRCPFVRSREAGEGVARHRISR